MERVGAPALARALMVVCVTWVAAASCRSGAGDSARHVCGDASAVVAAFADGAAAAQTRQHAPLPRPLTVAVEGWRGLPHSYSIVNSMLLREWLRRPDDVTVYHTDAAALSVHRRWRDGVASTSASPPPLFGVRDDDDAVMAIPPPPLSEEGDPHSVARFDVTWRAFMPYDLSPSPHSRATLVLGTCEDGVISASAAAPADLEALSAGATEDAKGDVTIVPPSEWSKAGFLAAGVSEDRAVVVPHGVDTDVFSPVERGGDEWKAARAALWKLAGLEKQPKVKRGPPVAPGEKGKKHKPFVFLHVGSMDGRKGVRDLVLAFAGVSKSHPHTFLVLKGVDPMYGSHATLKSGVGSQIMGLARKGSILYIGDSLSFADMAALYRAADAYVSPYHAEGFNMPVLEAAASGLPVVATEGGPTDEFTDESFALRIESTPETVAGGGTHLVPSGASLAQHMHRLVTDASFRDTAAAAGPRFVRRHGYRWSDVADRMLRLFAEKAGVAGAASSEPSDGEL